MSKIFYDTSILMTGTLPFCFDTTEYVVPSVIFELENLKTKYKEDGGRLFAVRQAFKNFTGEDKKIKIFLPNERKVERFIKKHNLPDNQDSRIIVGSLLENPSANFYTCDRAQFLIGEIFFPGRIFYHQPVATFETKEEEYVGWRKLYPTDKELEALYADSNINHFNLKVNEYAELYQGTNLVDIVRWDGQKYSPVKFNNIRSHYMGDIKPLDPEQKMAFDMLQNKDIKVQLLLGGYGCGKSFLALAHAIDFVQRGLYDGIVFIRNNYELKDTKSIGALPGDELTKLYPYLMPIADHVGGVEGLDMLIENHIIEPVHLGFIRGRDIQRKIIFCDECENMTKQQVQLLIGRISKGSQLWLVGDRKQTDSVVFEKNSGINALIRGLAGNPLFGMVKLVQSHRSDAAKLADILDME